MRAIDLYSGVGGWSLGLRLAGIDVVASYEQWGAANETNFKNNHHQAQTVDIRRLDLRDLPSNIDIVVGSPPCTQFSYSNRGGNGNICDGLVDIRKFLTIVDHLKPSGWVMENVPRLADILERELKAGGLLSDFAHLRMTIEVLNLEDFGLPQRRRRCFAGHFDPALLKSYKATQGRHTLGQVLDAISADPVIDPLFGMSVPQSELLDHRPEDFLNHEEERINRASKVHHPIYNAMPFPDPRHKAVRTITATCTRVSRESIVIDDPENSGKYRRLTVRERASLQGFPVTFQFYGQTYSQKLKMIGNAVPPAFSYLLGHALRKTPVKDLAPLATASERLMLTSHPAPVTPPDRTGRQYRPGRTFRFAIPALRLKSGVRFEFANRVSATQTEWLVRFVFGTSKDIRQINLTADLTRRLLARAPTPLRQKITHHLGLLTTEIEAADIVRMQQVWSRQGPGLTRPFMMLDVLNVAGQRLIGLLEEHPTVVSEMVRFAIDEHQSQSTTPPPGMAKLNRFGPIVAGGLLIGGCANEAFSRQAVDITFGRRRGGSAN
jgi:DNA (cytosine-5)-methyltransferase 1